MLDTNTLEDLPLVA